MAILASQTIVGVVGKVYDLRNVGKDNTAVMDFSVAVTPRRRNGDKWVDGETYWVTVTVWGSLAENVNKSFRVGDRVFVHGRVEMKEGYTNKEGVEVPARPIVVADFAGLEVSYDPAHSDREKKKSTSSAEPAAKRRSEPVVEMEEDDDLDLDDDMDFSDEDLPF